MFSWLEKLPLHLLILACLTVGLAPFTPPHIWEKLKMLKEGTLLKPLDIFDLLFHATPWILLSLKMIYDLRQKLA